MAIHPPPPPGSRIAVIGATGFLGAHIVHELWLAGFQPVAIARRPELIAEILPQVPVEARAADVGDPASLRVALAGCAAAHSTVALVDQAFITTDPAAEQQLIRTNVEGALNVLRAAHESGIGRVLLAGSCSMRYQRNGQVARESSPPTSADLVSDAYVRSKLALEQQARALAAELGLDVIITMPGALFGPGDRLPSMFGATLLKRFSGSADASLEGGLPLVDVRDVARAHARAMSSEHPSPAYLAVGETMSTQDWHALISSISGAPPVERFISAKMALTMARLTEAAAKLSGQAPKFNRNTLLHVTINQQFDCSLAREELGIAFTPVADTLRDTLAWFTEHGMVKARETG